MDTSFLARLRLCCVLLLSFSAWWMFSSPSSAETTFVKPVPTVANSTAFLSEIEAYLNTLRTLKATFEQSAPGMRPQRGTLVLARPGRMRLEYTPPPHLLLIADGRSIVYYDKELDQITYLDKNDLPIAFLLEDTIRFAQSGLDAQTVVNGTTVNLTLFRQGDSTLRPVTFTFSRDPLKLLHWTYVDEQGTQVTVTLNRLEENVRVKNSLFVFRNPRFGR
jgi:outer membrane lipoprotein-sorting protein